MNTGKKEFIDPVFFQIIVYENRIIIHAGLQTGS